jgi:transcriptional regulator with XRE-family HTH domain
MTKGCQYLEVVLLFAVYQGNRGGVMETFGQYLERILHQRRLTPKEAAKKCKITDSYIGRITKGQGGNYSVETILALADGLELDPHEVFAAATERPRPESGLVDPLFIVDLIQRILVEPRGLEVLQHWIRLSKQDQEELLKFIKVLNEQPKKKKSKGSQKSRKK